MDAKKKFILFTILAVVGTILVTILKTLFLGKPAGLSEDVAAADAAVAKAEANTDVAVADVKDAVADATLAANYVKNAGMDAQLEEAKKMGLL
jgi:hypothetical protein